APDIAGRNIANPYAMIMSGQMLMGWLGRKHGNERATAAADKMLAAVAQVVTQGKHVTRDLGGKASTQEMGDAIAAAVQSLLIRTGNACTIFISRPSSSRSAIRCATSAPARSGRWC